MFRRLFSYPRFGWLFIGLAILIVLLFIGIEFTWWMRLSPQARLALDAIALALFVLLAYVGLEQLRRTIQERDRLQAQLSRLEERLAQSYQHQAAIFRISQLLAEAQDEGEVIEQVLRYAIELLQAKGASFVPLDEQTQPQTAISRGELPAPVSQAWMEYLASPAIRRQCGGCQNYDQLSFDCPLLSGMALEASGMYCLPIRRGDQDYGVLNLYIPGSDSLDEQSRSFLRTLVDETSLALEGVRMRKRAMSTLRQLQATREKADLHALLSTLLENLQDMLDADYVQVRIVERENAPAISLDRGDLPEKTRYLVDSIAQSVMTSREPVMLANVSGDALSPPDVSALMAAPLLAQGQPALGALLAANRRSLDHASAGRAFNQGQLSALQTIAGQVALVVQNINLLAQVEYTTIVQERTRLAREIHDGLAQTLGFLKLKVAQMQNYLRAGDIETACRAMESCYEALSEAYLDARQAIDGLRILPSQEGLAGWLRQTADEFAEISGARLVLLEPLSEVSLPPEIHAQLIRIVQEALSNVRKHASARNVEISCREYAGELILEVRDDGVGFSPEDVPEPSQHGLRGMRERAELIGAEFQVIALPGQGTTVRVSLPLEVKERGG